MMGIIADGALQQGPTLSCACMLTCEDHRCCRLTQVHPQALNVIGATRLGIHRLERLEARDHKTGEAISPTDNGIVILPLREKALC